LKINYKQAALIPILLLQY